MALTRREVLAAVAGGVLAGCAGPSGPGRPGPPPGAPTHPVPDASAASDASAAPEPTAASGSTAVPQPISVSAPPAPPAPVPAAAFGRAAAVARYGALEPGQWGLEVPGVVTALPPGERAVALTFDACGGPGGSGYDAELIDVLRAHGVPATLFLNGRWIDANPAAFDLLAGEPLFELANHGTAHRPLSVTGRSAYGIAGTGGAGEVYDEIAGNTERLTALLGRPPRFFRSGTAHYDEVAVRIVGELGARVAGFTVNGDGGATLSAAQVHAEVVAAGPGSIVIGHLNHPGGGTARGIATAVPQLLAAGCRFVRLSDVLD
ncbi:polysaccharide deacetylase family protein [Kitasatospora sp. NPDC054939]